MTSVSALPHAMRRLIGCRAGSTAIEFAALGPIFVLLMLFVFQFATALQAYSSMVGAAADLQRTVTTSDQSGNTPTTTTIQNQAIAAATSKPYYLKAANLAVTVSTPSTQRISGAKEYAVTMTYSVPVMAMPSMKSFKFSFKRSVFVKSGG
ncbi:TadE/TadG family type IV pilus assembly protein [Novosphingobium cyanobacteriorum]|uniref:Pilus assembly protein n=1 Tax=Novosphingobium cyanobacteriorum TaxID=3024215 RepID=A0ABT6CHP5_9SPHN|nr:TadE/TadG family type IV pilus assembly protein [Novosphingobium cyanobacteriorum]MDF8331862.1 pilus assembly protein [Novosphingobium cyanobacteriorum]